METKIDAIIVAGGKGTRLGADAPKAFVALGGEAKFLHSVRIFESHPAIHTVILIVPEGMLESANDIVTASSVGIARPLQIAPGGEHRWQSVRNGAALSKADWVLVHDAARPFVTKKVIDALLDKRDRFRCAITGTPEVDTIRRVKHDKCIETIDRSDLIRVGTPQLFFRESLMGAFHQVEAMKQAPTDEAILMQTHDIEVGYAKGDPLNFKITTKTDLHIAEAILAARHKN